MKVVRLSLVLALAACAAAPPRENVPPALQPFTEAAEFLAPGFQSYEFAIEDEPDFTSEVEHYLRVVIARSGSDFQKPKDLGAGRCRGVEVRDYGAVRVATPWYRAGEPTEHIAGVPVWPSNGDALNFDREEPMWTAVVDARFHVRSADRDLLEAALLRTGRLHELVRPFDPVGDVPGDADRIVCLRERPEDRPYWGRPVPIETMVVAISQASRRLIAFHRLPLPAEFSAGFAMLAEGGATTSTSAAGWAVTEWRLATPPRQETRLWLIVLFGHAVFI